MQIQFKSIYLKKKFPLRISRGIHYGRDNLFVGLTKEGHTGWGAMAPGKTEGVDNVEDAQKQLEQFATPQLLNQSIYEINQEAQEQGLAPCALAALDIALWDLKAKQANLPLYRLLGLPIPKVLTSVTIGINTPEVTRSRLDYLLNELGIRCLKIKLGNPDGIEADKAMYAEVFEATKKHKIAVRVDANGGWDLEQAQHMSEWLAQRSCDYIEQPLKEGEEHHLPELYKKRPLPIFIDESCRFATDVVKHAAYVDGVNFKLMKCGGITEALHIIHTAKAHGLQVMVGCMGESAISIAAAAALTGVLDYVDLDSHLNLDPDPTAGAPLVNGIIMPTEAAGHGGYFLPSS